MQTRRPGKQTDHKVSPGALAAIAEAARRSREAGVGPEPRRSRGERPPAGGVTDQPVTASATPQATQPPVTTAPGGRPPTAPGRHPGGPIPAAGPTPSPSSDALRWAGSPPPAGPPGFARSPAGVPPPRTRRSGSNERRLRWAIGIALGVLVVVVAAVVGTTNHGNNGNRQPGGQATAITGSAGAGNSAAASGGSTGTTSGQGAVSPPPASIPTPTSTATSAPTTLAEPDGPPALSALAPASGQAGQTVTVTGSNFLSSSGRISAQVGGQTTPVACPAQTTCTVVIPPNPGSTPAAPVTITTDSGTSNALVFTYGTPAVVGVFQTPSCAVAGTCHFHHHSGGGRPGRH